MIRMMNLYRLLEKKLRQVKIHTSQVQTLSMHLIVFSKAGEASMFDSSDDEPLLPAKPDASRDGERAFT